MKSFLTEKWLVCRVCLKQPKDPMHNIFDENAEKDLTRMILECGGVPIKQFDHYPDKICAKCLRYLQGAYKFRVICQRSHKHLSRFIAPVDTTEIEVKQHEQEHEQHEQEQQDQQEQEQAEENEQEQEEQLEEQQQLQQLQDDKKELNGSQDALQNLSNITVMISENDDILFKIEPEDEEEEDLGIKQEYSEIEDNYDVVDVYEPMEEEIEEFEEFDSIEQSGTAMSNQNVEFLEDFIADISTSDEDFVPNRPKTPPRKRGRPGRPRKKPAIIVNNKKSPNRMIQAGIIKADGDDLYNEGVTTSVAIISQKKPSGLKRGPKPKKIRETAYICDVCGNLYPSQGRLTEHIKLHKGIKPHECEICGHAFAQTQQLARHMNTHTGNRPFKCSYCPAAFADLSTRNKHHRIHTNERPYVCDVCGKTFTYTNTLKFHKMIHTGEKPYVCDICGKGFQQAYKMRNHKLTHEKKGIKLEKLEVETLVIQEVNDAAAQILEI